VRTINKPIAPPSKRSVRLIVQLNDRWRVVDSPPHWHPEWILQRKKGSAGAKSSGWEGSAYCTDRESLLRNIRERCGDVDPTELAIIESLPEKHPPKGR